MKTSNQNNAPSSIYSAVVSAFSGATTPELRGAKTAVQTGQYDHLLQTPSDRSFFMAGLNAVLLKRQQSLV